MGDDSILLGAVLQLAMNITVVIRIKNSGIFFYYMHGFSLGLTEVTGAAPMMGDNDKPGSG